jgi:hypothetical protein
MGPDNNECSCCGRSDPSPTAVASISGATTLAELQHLIERLSIGINISFHGGTCKITIGSYLPMLTVHAIGLSIVDTLQRALRDLTTSKPVSLLR